MTETNGSTGTLTRPAKHSDTSHPHYFTSFQNYCCGPKAKDGSSSANKDLLPIPDSFKSKAERMLTVLNQDLIEHTKDVVHCTSSIPREFFESSAGASDVQRYIVDRTMLKTMNDAHVINWMPSLKKIYPVRTSGERAMTSRRDMLTPMTFDLGNGNCLLHAVLIGLIGVHDFSLYLRDQLVQFMEGNKVLLKQSWKIERLRNDQLYGIQSEDSILDSVSRQLFATESNLDLFGLL